MHRSDRWPEEETDPPRSRASSRRNSASLSRRNSVKKEKEVKKVPLSSAPSSATSTPKKTAKPANLDFIVTGKQILKRSDRANSLPGAYHRRTSIDATVKLRKAVESPKRVANTSQSSKSQETSLEDDMSLDLSQVSDFEDTNSKYGIRKFHALATSTPKVARGKPRSASLQSQLQSQRVESRRTLRSLDSTKQSFSCSRDSFNSCACSTPHKYTSELDYSSVSPEYSGQSSAELSPSRASQPLGSPPTQDMQLSSCCVSTWAECSEADTKVEDSEPGVRGGEPLERGAGGGEWSSFWANYNNSLAKVPMKNYYDQCPTPYRTDKFDLADFELSDCSRKRSPDADIINDIILQQGLQLTPRDTQNIIKCAHLLGSVLSRAIERRATPNKHTMTLPLNNPIIPSPPKATTSESTTQTDISLPNTKSAPRIFENILRQLSRSSIDVDKIKEGKSEMKKQGSVDKSEVKKQASIEKGASVDKNEIKNQVSMDKSEIISQRSIEKCEIKSQRSIEKSEVKKQSSIEKREKNEVKSENVNEVKSECKNEVVNDKNAITEDKNVVDEVKNENKDDINSQVITDMSEVETERKECNEKDKNE